MNSYIVFDAFMLGVKEAGKIGLLYLIFRSCRTIAEKKYLLNFFFLGIILSLAAGIFGPLLQAVQPLKSLVGKLILSSFAIFILAGAMALLRSPGMPFVNPLPRSGTVGSVVYGMATLVLSVLFVFPEALAAGFAIRELGFLRESLLSAFISFGAGCITVGIAAYYVYKGKLVKLFGEFFAVPQLLVLCATLKLLGSGMGEGQATLIPALQAGLMKFFHDVTHQNLVLFMIPDHMLLKTTTWKFIGILFGSGLSLFVALSIVLSIPLCFLYFTLLIPPVIPEAVTGAEKRKLRSLVLADRRKKAVPVMLFIFIVVMSWYIKGGDTAPRLQTPVARPVVAENNIIRIPFVAPEMNVKDGKLHKFVLLHEGKEIRFIVMRKPDNNISVCLDACEICPPEGYGLREKLVICIYCNTPIPVDTLGVPGGCNPIPLDAKVAAEGITVTIDELMKKARLINTRKGNEPAK